MTLREFCEFNYNQCIQFFNESGDEIFKEFAEYWAKEKEKVLYNEIKLFDGEVNSNESQQ